MVWCVNSPSTVPEIKCQVAHELSMAMLDIDGGSETPDVFGDIVAEDDAAHGGLAGTALAHQQDLLFTFASVHVEYRMTDGRARGCRAGID